MGIKDDDSLIGGQPVVEGGEYPKAAAPQPTMSGAAPDMGMLGSWYTNASDRNPLGAIIGPSVGNELVNTLRDKLVEIYKSASKEIAISVIPVYHEQNDGFYFSCIVVAVTRAGTKKTAYYVLILEGTNSPLSTVTRNVGGATVEVTLLSSNAADSELFSRIKSTVLEPKFAGHEIITVDSCVIPRDFDVKDDAAVRKVAYVAALACGNELAISTPNFQDINIQKLTRSSPRSLNILLNFGRISKYDAVNNPVRSDVRCIFKDTPPTKTNPLAVNSASSSTYLAEVNGFIDVTYVGGNEVNPYMVTQQIKVDNYAPRFIVTDIERLPGYTIGAMLLAISTISVLSRDNYWMMAFRPQSNTRGIDITDIGALGYELDLTRNPETAYKKIDTKSESFDSSQLALFLSTIMKPGLIVSLDVPDSGPQTWYTRIFAAGARGVVNPLNRIVQAAVNLTGGIFPANFDPNNIFTDVGNRIHLGYYFNKDGQKRDIREIDYLAVANVYGETDKQKIVDWSDTFNRNIDLDLRLAERKKILQAITDNHLELTGYAERVTFSKDFLGTLVNSISAAGLHANLVPPLSTENFNAVRAGANYDAAAFTVGAGFASPFANSASRPYTTTSNYVDSRF
jgi:hypothetical protein